MRISTFIIALFTFYGLSFTQGKEIKNDSISVLGETHYSLIHYKGKTCLYNNNRKEIEIKPNKNFFHFFEESSYLMEVNSKGAIKTYSLQEELILVDNSQSICLFIFERQTNEIKKLKSSEHKSFRHLGNGFFGISKTEDRLLVYNHNTYFDQYSMEAVPLTNEYGEDSTITLPDGTYEVVYMDLWIPNIEKSGVYNMKSKQWEIHPKYANILKVNDIYICAKSENRNEILKHDIYRSSKKNIQASKYMDVGKTLDLPYELFFEEGTYWTDRDPRYIYYSEGNTKGLFYFQLHRPVLKNDYSLDYFENLITPSRFDTLFLGEYDYIRKLHIYGDLFVVGKNDRIVLSYFDFGKEKAVMSWISAENEFFNASDENGEAYPSIDGMIYKDSCKSKEIKPCFYNTNNPVQDWKNKNTGARKLTDSTIYLHCFEPEHEDESMVLHNEWGEDSLDSEGNVVYFNSEPGVYESGVYNFKSNKWIISPDKAWILKTYDGYLSMKPKLDANLNLIEYYFTLHNNQGEVIKKEWPEKEFYNTVKNQKFLIPTYKIDTIYKLDYNPIESSWEDFVYFKSGQLTGLAQLENSSIKIPPKEFCHFYQEHNLVTTIENKFIHISINDHEYKGHINLEANSLKQIEISFSPGSSILYVNYSSKDDSTYSLMSYNTETEEFLNDSVITQNNAMEEFDISILKFVKLDHNNIYIEDYQKDQYEDFPYADIYGEDSLDINGNPVYIEWKGYQRSGVYNFQNKYWEVPQKFTKLFGYDSGLSIFSNIDQDDNSEYTFYNGDHEITKFNYTNFKNEPLIDLLSNKKEWDSTKTVIDNNDYNCPKQLEAALFHYKNDKVGVYDLLKLNSLIPYSDMVHTSPYRGIVSYLKGDSLFFQDLGSKNKSNQSIHIRQSSNNNLASFHMTPSDYGDKYECYRVDKFNDSLLIYTVGEVADKMPLFNEWGEDSIDVEGNWVHISTQPRIQKSGVYNLNQNKWLIQPMYQWIKITNGKYIVERNTTNESDNILQREYTVFNNDFSIEIAKKQFEDLPKNYQEFLKQECKYHRVEKHEWDN